MPGAACADRESWPLGPPSLHTTATASGQQRALLVLPLRGEAWCEQWREP